MEAEIPDDEELLTFLVRPEQLQIKSGVARVTSALFFSDTIERSLNRSTIWPLEKHRELKEPHWGIVGITAHEVRSVFTVPHSPLDVLHTPGDDTLVKRFNPSHCDVSRPMDRKESRRAAERATERVYEPFAPNNDG